MTLSLIAARLASSYYRQPAALQADWQLLQVRPAHAADLAWPASCTSCMSDLELQAGCASLPNCLHFWLLQACFRSSLRKCDACHFHPAAPSPAAEGC